MNIYFRTLCVLLTASALLTSCLKDDDQNVISNGDMAITGVTLGSLNRYTQTTSASTGNDTIIKSTISGSSYKMNIDQLGHQIFNPDSLPVGTDLKHVLISSISTKNNATVVIKSLISDSLFYISSTDSIDFTQPRTLRVYANDGSGYRDYTMTLAASSSTGITFEWKLMGTLTDMHNWTDMHLVTIGDSIALVERGIIVSDDMAYRMNGHTLERSEDLANWQAVAGGLDLKMLLGSATREMYAMGNDGRLKASTDNGVTWSDELLDEDAGLLPDERAGFTTWNYEPADSTNYVLLAGPSQKGDGTMAVWRKISPYDSMAKSGQWVYMPVDDCNRYGLPWQEYLSLMYYSGSVLAVGSNLTILQSRDQGITWKKNNTYKMPAALEGTSVAMAADARERLWLVSNAGQVWLGMLR